VCVCIGGWWNGCAGEVLDVVAGVQDGPSNARPAARCASQSTRRRREQHSQRTRRRQRRTMRTQRLLIYFIAQLMQFPVK